MKTTKLAGLVKADVIERIVERCLSDKTWRSECEREVVGKLTREERQERKAEVLSYVKACFDAAGAGWNGRWQS